jgi:hypothetical protein
LRAESSKNALCAPRDRPPRRGRTLSDPDNRRNPDFKARDRGTTATTRSSANHYNSVAKPTQETNNGLFNEKVKDAPEAVIEPEHLAAGRGDLKEQPAAIEQFGDSLAGFCGFNLGIGEGQKQPPFYDISTTFLQTTMSSSVAACHYQMR